MKSRTAWLVAPAMLALGRGGADDSGPVEARTALSPIPPRPGGRRRPLSADRQCGADEHATPPMIGECKPSRSGGGELVRSRADGIPAIGALRRRSAPALLYVGTVGQVHDRRGVDRNRDGQRQDVSVDAPVADDGAVNRVERGLGRREPATWAWSNGEALVPRAGFVELDAGNRRVHPFADRTERVMIERVHRGILELTVGLDAVPALPDGRGALADLVAPRRIGVAVQELIRAIELAPRGQGRQKMRNADEPGAEVPAVSRHAGVEP